MDDNLYSVLIHLLKFDKSVVITDYDYDTMEIKISVALCVPAEYIHVSIEVPDE